MKRHTTGDVCLGFREEIPPDEDLEEVTHGWQYFKSRDRVSRDGKRGGPRGAQNKDSHRLSERGRAGGRARQENRKRSRRAVKEVLLRYEPCADGRSRRRRPDLRTSHQS